MYILIRSDWILISFDLRGRLFRCLLVYMAHKDPLHQDLERVRTMPRLSYLKLTFIPFDTSPSQILVQPLFSIRNCSGLLLLAVVVVSLGKGHLICIFDPQNELSAT